MFGGSESGIRQLSCTLQRGRERGIAIRVDAPSMSTGLSAELQGFLSQESDCLETSDLRFCGVFTVEVGAQEGAQVLKAPVRAA